jgi:hypothetical protein
MVNPHDHEPDACEARARVRWDTLWVKAESDFPGDGNGPGEPEDWVAYMTTSIGTAKTSDIFEEPMDFWRGKYWFRSPADDLRGQRLSVQTDEGCAYNVYIR